MACIEGSLCGLLYAIIASLLWSINPPIIKMYGGNTSAIAFNALRTLFASLFLGVVVIFTGFSVVWSPLGFMFILISSLIGPGFGDIVYIRAVRIIGAGRAITIGYTYIFVAQLLSMLFLKEKLGLGVVVGTIIALLGIYLVSHDDNEVSSSSRMYLAFIPSLAWGVGSVANKLALMYTDPVSLGFMRVALLSIMLSPALLREFSKVSRKVIGAAIITGGLGYGLGIPLFLKAIELVGVSITVLVTALTPVLGRITSSLIAYEKATIKGAIGTLLVTVGILIGATLSI